MKLFSNFRKTYSMDLDSSQIKVVEGKCSKKAISINKSFTINLPQGIYTNGVIEDMDQMVYILKEAFKDYKISGNYVNGIINSTDIINREISIPKVEDSQIQSVINYQIEDYIPINSEDYVIQHLVLGNDFQDGVEKLNIMIIGVPKSMVESHLNLFRNIGLRPSVLEYQANAMGKLLAFNDYINGDIDIEGKSIASIDLGYDHTALTIVKNNKTKISRLLAIGELDIVKSIEEKDGISEAETRDFLYGISDINEHEEYVVEIVQVLLERIEMVLRYYRARDLDNNIDLLLLQGNLSNVAGMDKLFTNFFNLPAIQLNSLNKVKFQGNLYKYSDAIAGLIRRDEV